MNGVRSSIALAVPLTVQTIDSASGAQTIGFEHEHIVIGNVLYRATRSEVNIGAMTLLELLGSFLWSANANRFGQTPRNNEQLWPQGGIVDQQIAEAVRIMS